MFHPTGTLVWAKQRTYPAWPAIVAPNTSGITQKTQKKKSLTHVIFLEYNKEHAWVLTKNIAEFTGADDDNRVKIAVDTAIGITNGDPVVRREGATNMQREVGRNGEDVSVHENDEAVAVNKNGREKARVKKGVTPNRAEGAANMQHEVARNDKDDVSDHESTEPVTVNTNRRNKVRKEKSAEAVTVNPYYMPERSTNPNNRRNSPPHAQTSENGNQTCSFEQTNQNRTNKKVKVTFEMEEDTWFKILELAPKCMEMAHKFIDADS